MRLVSGRRVGATFLSAVIERRYLLRMSDLDMAWLKSLGPEQELIARLALRDVCDRCGDDPAFKQRTDELLAGTDPRRLVHILRAAARKKMLLWAAR